MTAFPKVRDDVLQVRLVERGETMYTYRVPETSNCYRIDPIQHEIFSLMDGSRSQAEIAEAFNAKGLGMSIDADFVEEYVANMKETDILLRTREEEKALLLEKIRDERRRRAANPAQAFSLLDIKLSAWNPDPFFDRILPYFRFLFTPGFVMVSAASMIAMLGVWALEWPRIRDGTATLFSFQGKTGVDLFQFFVILFFVSFLHESAHGLTCKYFGGHVPRMGFMLIYFTPCFFVEVSDAFLFPKHYQRQWVIYAGGYIEIFVCSLATFVWALAYPGSLLSELAWKTLLMTGLTSIIINYNPFIKIDGYYSLMDYLEIPDLWERSSAYVSGWIKKNILGLPVELEPLSRKVRRIMVSYALLSVVYKLFIFTAILTFCKNVFVNLFGNAGYSLLGLTLLLVLRRPLRSLGGLIRFTFLDKREVIMSTRTLLTAGTAAAFALAVLLLVPLPHTISGESTLEPASTAVVRPQVEGRVRAVHVREGAVVDRGALLATLANPALEREASLLRERLRQCDLEIRESQEQGRLETGVMKMRERDWIVAALQTLEERAKALALRSPLRGTVITPRIEEQEGVHLDPGQAFCEVAVRDGWLVRVPIRERRTGDVRVGQEVDLNLAAFPFRTLRGRVVSVAPSPENRLDSADGSPLAFASFAPSPSGDAEPAPEPLPGQEFTDFEVIAGVDDAILGLRSGMKGVARIHLQKSTLAARGFELMRRWTATQIW